MPAIAAKQREKRQSRHATAAVRTSGRRLAPGRKSPRLARREAGRSWSSPLGASAAGQPCAATECCLTLPRGWLRVLTDASKTQHGQGSPKGLDASRRGRRCRCHRMLGPRWAKLTGLGPDRSAMRPKASFNDLAPARRGRRRPKRSGSGQRRARALGGPTEGGPNAQSGRGCPALPRAGHCTASREIVVGNALALLCRNLTRTWSGISAQPAGRPGCHRRDARGHVDRQGSLASGCGVRVRGAGRGGPVQR